MRKYLHLVLVALLSFTVFLSCAKETPFTVSGKTYAAFGYHADSFTYGIFHWDGYDAYYVLRFTSEKSAEKSTREANPQGRIIGDLEDCSVTINYPSIIVSYTENGRLYTEKGTFITQSIFRLTSSSGKISEYILQ